MKVGIRHGGVLSSTLFNLVMVGFNNLGAVWITESAFADDILLLTRNEREFQKNMKIWK